MVDFSYSKHDILYMFKHFLNILEMCIKIQNNELAINILF